MSLKLELVADAVGVEPVEGNNGEIIIRKHAETQRELGVRAKAMDVLVSHLPCMHCESGCVTPAVCAVGARAHAERLTYKRFDGTMRHPVSQEVARALVTVGGVN